MIKDAFDGFPVVLLADDEVVRERRTWRERLLSRPWRPWRAWRLRRIPPQCPPGQAMPEGMMVVVGGRMYVREKDWAAFKERYAKLAQHAAAAAAAAGVN